MANLHVKEELAGVAQTWACGNPTGWEDGLGVYGGTFRTFRTAVNCGNSTCRGWYPRPLISRLDNVTYTHSKKYYIPMFRRYAGVLYTVISVCFNSALWFRCKGAQLRTPANAITTLDRCTLPYLRMRFELRYRAIDEP